MRVAVLYASDYASLSPGGIREFILRVGAVAPSSVAVDYVGVGRGHCTLPRPQDTFFSIVPYVGAGKLNAQYVRALLLSARTLRRYDVVIAHRPEYLLATPRSASTSLVLHGGTWNALKTGRRAFGLGYAVAETVACARSSRVLSVRPEGVALLSRALARKTCPIRVPATEAFRAVHQDPNPSPRLLTASRLVEEKRLARLVHLSAMTGRELVIFGDGPLRNDLESLAARLSARVRFAGAVTPGQLAGEYAAGGVFCLSSRFEGYPLAAVEAAVSGLPVIGVETDGLEQLVPFGVRVFDTVAAAASALCEGAVAPVDRDRVWQAHAPESVGETFWRMALGQVRELS